MHVARVVPDSKLTQPGRRIRNELLYNPWAGALVYWLWDETHVPKNVGSNTGAIYWMDITFFHIEFL